MKASGSPAETLFNKILADAKADANIIGFLLTGSRGKGIFTEDADYDFTMMVEDDVVTEYKKRYEHLTDPNVEGWVTTLDGFRRHAAWGRDKAWDRYNFAHLMPLVDKTGQLPEILQEKSSIPDVVRKDFVAGHLDGYINQVYRSLKCFRDGQAAGARLEAADSVKPLLDVLFGMHGRLRPYYKYLAWELKTFPLEKLTCSPSELTESILEILETGSILAQQKILQHVEAMARVDGFGYVFDGWGPKLDWMKDIKQN